MATENKQFLTTFEAKEDLNSHQYLAIALDDGKVANNAEEASGILQNKPEQNEYGTLCYLGESRFNAGGALSAGDKITITTSGYFVTADSNDPIVGETKADVTSGSVGTGLFDFPPATDKGDAVLQSITPLVDLIKGTAIALDDFLQADNGEEADGVAIAAMTSGTAANVVVSGKAQVRMDPAECSSAGDALTVTTSGYFSIGGSGDYICAKALANIGSDSTGDGLFSIGHYLSV